MNNDVLNKISSYHETVAEEKRQNEKKQKEKQLAKMERKKTAAGRHNLEKHQEEIKRTVDKKLSLGINNKAKTFRLIDNSIDIDDAILAEGEIRKVYLVELKKGVKKYLKKHAER